MSAGETIINENTKVYEAGSVYVGDLTDGKRHGQGTHLPLTIVTKANGLMTKNQDKAASSTRMGVFTKVLS